MSIKFLSEGKEPTMKKKNQLDATKYSVVLPQHVSGTNMPIIRSTINKYLSLSGGHTWKRYAK
jgi:hypothetical protein